MDSKYQLRSNTGVEELEPVLQRQAGRSEYPLSLNQQHLWFHSQLDPESTLWNLGVYLSISGPLDVATFIQAIQNTVDRHEIMRTVFTLSADDAPLQKVIQHVDVRCGLRDLPSDLPERDREAMVRAWMATLADPMYDLGSGPLFRTELLRAEHTQHYFLFAFHHLLLDGFYSGQFVMEVVSAYDRLRRGEPLPDEPSLQFGDFCVWQQERWSNGLMAEMISFWRGELREPLPELLFPCGSPISVPHAVKAHSLCPDAEVVGRLREIGRQARTTLFRVTLAIFTVFFSRFNRSGEVMLDIDFSTRPREMGRNVGFFANVLPVRLQVHKEETFIDVLGAVDLQLREVSVNRELPVGPLIQKFKLHRDTTQPLTPVGITQVAVMDWSLGELQLKGSIYVSSSSHDVWLGVVQREDDLEIMLAQEWAAEMQTLVNQVAVQPDVPLWQLEVFRQP